MFCITFLTFYICVKFHQTIWNGFQLTERTRVYCRNCYFKYLLRSNVCDSKSRLTRVNVFVFCTFSILWCFTFVRNFIKISQMVFNLQSGHDYMVEMVMFNVQIGNNSKSRQIGVTVNVFCTFSYSALRLCEVS